MSGGAVVVRKQNKYIAQFNQLGAIDAAHAIFPEEHGIRKNYIFGRMEARGVFIRCQDGRYYIDNQAAVQFKEARRKRAVIVMAVVLLFAAVYYVLGGR